MNEKSVNALRNGPTVCAVNKDYMICVPVKKKVLMKVKVGNREFFCHSNGIRISDTPVQKFWVPGELLNREKKYTVCYETIIKREPYSCAKLPEVSLTYEFKPLTKTEDINIYHVSDTHGMHMPAVKAASYFKDDLDLFILNGDISSSSQTAKDIMLTYDIAYDVTKGRIPCIISRGNHDLRGNFAEKLQEFLPTDNGKTYYTVSLGVLWFCLMDCGEDKEDWHREYSGTVCCHTFRTEETEFLDRVIAGPETEFRSSEIRYPIMLSHVPYCWDNVDVCRGETPFNIETELFTDWCRKIKEHISPDFLLVGHLHQNKVLEAGSAMDNKGIGCPIVVGSKPLNNKKCPDFIGCAITLQKQNAVIRFTDSKGKVQEEHNLKLKK